MVLCLSELQGIPFSVSQPKGTAGFLNTYILEILVYFPLSCILKLTVKTISF